MNNIQVNQKNNKEKYVFYHLVYLKPQIIIFYFISFSYIKYSVVIFEEYQIKHELVHTNKIYLKIGIIAKMHMNKPNGLLFFDLYKLSNEERETNNALLINTVGILIINFFNVF